jgi:hypothetical protein
MSRSMMSRTRKGHEGVWNQRVVTSSSCPDVYAFSMAFKVRVTVRDGRTEREGGPAGVTPSGKGAILQKFESDRLLELRAGDAVALRDGSNLMVIRTDESFAGEYWEQTIYVANLPPRRPSGDAP